MQGNLVRVVRQDTMREVSRATRGPFAAVVVAQITTSRLKRDRSFIFETEIAFSVIE